MKLIILQENLSRGLTIVGKVANSKGQLPILGNILFEANKEGLKITGTNLETGINIFLPAKTEETGSITVPARIITELIASLPADKVFLNVNKEKLEVVCLSYKAVVNGIAAFEFPNVPSFKKAKDQGKKVQLEKEKIFKAIEQTAFAAATDTTRPVLNGVRISIKDGKIQMAATDGYRLSLSEFKTANKINFPTLIVPARALIEVARIINSEEVEQIEIAITKEANQVIFIIGNTEIVSRLIEGELPEFGKIIPQEKGTEITIDREEFLRSTRTASIFAKDSANIIKLEVKKNKLKMMANAPEIGENEIELDVKTKGEEIKIAFNCRFLQDFLNIFSEESFILEVLGSLKPGLFKTPEGSSFLHIIMPVRVQD